MRPPVDTITAPPFPAKLEWVNGQWIRRLPVEESLQEPAVDQVGVVGVLVADRLGLARGHHGAGGRGIPLALAMLARGHGYSFRHALVRDAVASEQVGSYRWCVPAERGAVADVEHRREERQASSPVTSER